MLDVTFIAQLIRLTLQSGPFPHIGRAVPLLLGTCAQESGFQYNQQLGGGPALGYWQCEQATEMDVWTHFLAYQPTLRAFFEVRCGQTMPDPDALQHNLVYQILMARTHYYRCDTNALPMADDLTGQSELWKRVYNTPAGAGTPDEYVANYHRLVSPHYPPPRGRSRG